MRLLFLTACFKVLPGRNCAIRTSGVFIRCLVLKLIAVSALWVRV
jgi:hypothetical protein